MSDLLRPGHLFAELRRRRVLRVAAVYGAVAWLVIQISATAFPHLALPPWSVTLVIVLLLVGFPIAVVLGWAFDITPDGVQRTQPLGADARRGSGSRLARAVAPVLVIVAAGVFGGYLHLQRTDEGRGDAAQPSIAVLPFVNMSGDVENEYFSDGLTEELLNLLAQVSDLRVAARTSAFAFKNVNDDVGEIGRRLNVDWVLEGSVRRGGDRLRVTAQLIRVSNGYHEWSDAFDGAQTREIFDIQDSIARAIVAHLVPRVAGRPLAVHGGTSDVAAYDEYLKGRYAFWRGSTEPNLRSAIRHYEAALARDSSYALAWAGLSDALMLLGGQHAPPRDVFPQSKRAALRALALDDQLAEGYVALASINWFYEWDWGAAERNYRRSFSVNRAVYTRCICYVWYLAVIGDMEAAVREGERARSLDPVAHLPMTTLAQMYFLAGRTEEARAMLRELEQAGSTSALIPRLDAWIAWDQGRTADALALMERFRNADDPRALAETTYMLAGSGRDRDARDVASRLEQLAQQRYTPPEYLAVAFAAIGRDEDAAAWIERAYEQRSNLGMFSAYPVSRALAHLPAYHSVMRRVGIPASGPAVALAH
jgi:adenylate cyclase